MSRVPLLIGLLAGLACQDPVSPARVVVPDSPMMARSAPQVSNERVPVWLNIIGCTGEQVIVSGEAHLVTKVWNTADEFRVMTHENVNIVGTGVSTGREYRFLETWNSDYEFTWRVGYGVQDVVTQLKLIASGAASDWHLTMHGTYVYEDGLFRFVLRRWESVCT
jgi:hypothetical protein